jgi:hypothetical protein
MANFMTPDLSTPAKKKAFAESQQMPTYQPSMEDMENTWRLQALRCKEDRLAAAAREIPEVAELIEELKTLKKASGGHAKAKPAK